MTLVIPRVAFGQPCRKRCQTPRQSESPEAPPAAAVGAENPRKHRPRRKERRQQQEASGGDNNESRPDERRNERAPFVCRRNRYATAHRSRSFSESRCSPRSKPIRGATRKRQRRNSFCKSAIAGSTTRSSVLRCRCERQDDGACGREASCGTPGTTKPRRARRHDDDGKRESCRRDNTANATHAIRAGKQPHAATDADSSAGITLVTANCWSPRKTRFAVRTDQHDCRWRRGTPLPRPIGRTKDLVGASPPR